MEKYIIFIEDRTGTETREYIVEGKEALQNAYDAFDRSVLKSLKEFIKLVKVLRTPKDEDEYVEAKILLEEKYKETNKKIAISGRTKAGTYIYTMYDLFGSIVDTILESKYNGAELEEVYNYLMKCLENEDGDVLIKNDKYPTIRMMHDIAEESDIERVTKAVEKPKAKTVKAKKAKLETEVKETELVQSFDGPTMEMTTEEVVPSTEVKSEPPTVETTASSAESEKELEVKPEVPSLDDIPEEDSEVPSLDDIPEEDSEVEDDNIPVPEFGEGEEGEVAEYEEEVTGYEIGSYIYTEDDLSAIGQYLASFYDAELTEIRISNNPVGVIFSCNGGTQDEFEFELVTPDKLASYGMLLNL